MDIPIHIYPARLTDENYGLLKKQYKDEKIEFHLGGLRKIHTLNGKDELTQLLYLLKQ